MYGDAARAEQSEGVVARFERCAAELPHSPAVETSAQRVTYRELEQYASSVARVLTERQEVRGGVVALCFQHGVDFVAAMLGVLKSGAAFLPLDPEHPEARVGEALRDSGARLVLTHAASAERIPAGIAPVLLLHEAPLTAGTTSQRGDRAEPRDLAYIIYTSGSSGHPKGVLIEHGSLSNFVADQIQRLGLGVHTRTLQFSSHGFDAMIWEIFATLCAGGTVCTPRGNGAQRVAQLAKTVSALRVNLAFLTPAVLETIDPADAATLQTVLTGGERVPASLVSRWRERDLWVCYGTTETTIYTTMGDGSGDESLPTLGFPLANNKAALMDPESLEPVPPGQAGEIWIGGAGVGRGYLGRPEETARCFIERSNDVNEPERWYRTGDLGRLASNGSIVFLGRLDRQVKIRAQRLELEEIEARLVLHPQVARALVVKHGVGAREQLVAFVRPQAGCTGPSASELRELLEQSLPGFMIPKLFHVTLDLPLLVGGKVDRAGLSALAETLTLREEGPLAVASPDAVSELWSRTLPRGRQEEFFAAGGDSLLAVELLGAVARVCRVQVALHRFLEQPTRSWLSQWVSRASTLPAAAHLPSATAGDHTAFQPFSMTPLQEAYWVGTNADLPLSGVATQCCFEYQTEELDTARLEAALNALFVREPALRTVSLEGARQRVLPAPPHHYSVEVRDLSGAPDRGSSLRALKDECWRDPWPTGAWPRVELCVAKMRERDYRTLVRYDFSVLDLAGFAAVMSDLSDLYEDPQAGLPVPVSTFERHVRMAQALQTGETCAAARSYWEARLEGLPSGPRLPLATNVHGLRQQRVLRESAVLDRATWRTLQQRAAAYSLTPSVLLLAVYAEVLAYWSDTGPFLLNLPVHQRTTTPGSPREQARGDFTSVVLLALELPSASFCERAASIQRQLWRDLDHAAFDGVEVARSLAQRRDTSAGVAPVVFTGLAPEAHTRSLTRNVCGTQIDGRSSTPQVWLDYQLREFDGQLLLFWDHVEALFPPGLQRELFAANQRLLHALAEDELTWEASPAVIGALLQPPDQRQRLAAFNAAQFAFPPATLSSLFKAAARRYGQRVALLMDGVEVSYAELSERATRLAAYLRQTGSGPGERVAVVCDKGVEQVVAVLAVVLSGAAYVPLSPGLPEQRLSSLLQRSNPRCVLTRSAVAQGRRWPDGSTVIAVDQLECMGDGATQDSQEMVDVEPDALAYIIYTSGSTGEPKGVMMSHAAVVNTVLDINERFGVGNGDRIFGFSDLSFDLSVWDLFGTFAAGATLVLPAVGAWREPDEWLQLCRRYEVTVWNSVPQVFLALMRECQAAREPLRSLRLGLLSGDWIALELPALAREQCPNARLVSLGGATEAAIWSIHFPMTDVSPGWSSIPYGYPLTNQRCYVLDGAFRPCPDWTTGELYIAGAGLALGYHGSPALTRERFLLHPQTGERLYRTGDLARRRSEGFLELLGRVDEQVKINGFRLELGEVEAELRRNAPVRNAVALAIGSRGSNRRLVAWVESESEVDVAALREALEARLPSYAVPAAIYVARQLPLSSNGKVDRAMLASEAQDAARDVKSAAAPALTAAAGASGLYAILAGIWCQLLETTAVAPEDDFFALGGDSILVMQAVSQARLCGIRLKTVDFYRARTLAELARRAQWAAVSQEGAPSRRLSGEVALLPGQRWFLEQGLLDAHLWQEGHVLIPEERLEFDALRRALVWLHEHHDALRSRFSRRDAPCSAGWRQEISSTLPQHFLRHADLPLRADQESLEHLQESVREAQARLNLSSGPVLCGTLVEHGEGRQSLVLVGHHLVIDGYSWRILFEDLQALYPRMRSGSSALDVAKTTDIQRWGELVRSAATSEAAQRETGFWLQEVQRPSDSIAVDSLAEPLSEEAHSIYTALDAGTTAQLLHRLTALGAAAVREIVLTAILRVLGPASAGLFFDLMMHGRHELDEQCSLTRTVGRLTSVYPVHLCIDREASAVAQLAAVSSQIQQSPSGGFYYGPLRYREGEERLRSPARLCFNYAGRFDHLFASSGPFKRLVALPRTADQNMRGVRQHLLEWNVFVVNQALVIEWRFSLNTHRMETVRRWAEDCLQEVRSLVRVLA